MRMVVLPCDCTSQGIILVKCAGARFNDKPRWLPRLFATAGALYQDRHYGNGMRLHSVRIDNKGKLKGHTCSVCGRQKIT